MKSKVFMTDHYLNKNTILLAFLLMVVGTLIPALSGMFGLSFWEKLFYILTSSFFNTMFYICISLIVIHTTLRLSKNYNYITRYQQYSNLLKHNSCIIIRSVCELYIMAVIVAVAGAIIFSFFNFNGSLHPTYSIYLPIYLLFFLGKSIIIHCTIGVLIYLGFIIFKRNITIGILIFFLLMFYVNFSFFPVVEHFYQLPFLFHSYLLDTIYSSFILEIICTSLYIIVLIFFTKGVFWFVARKKREYI